MSPLDRSRFAQRFAQEAREQLARLNEGFLALGRDAGDDRAWGETTRAAHTLKGSARMLKFIEVSRLAHGIEDVLGAVRAGRVTLEAVQGPLYRALDCIEDCIVRIEKRRDDPVDTEPVIAALASADAAAPDAAVEGAEADPDQKTDPDEKSGPSNRPDPSNRPEQDAAAVDEAIVLQVADNVRVQTSSLEDLVRLAGEIGACRTRLQRGLAELNGLRGQVQRLQAVGDAQIELGHRLAASDRSLRQTAQWLDGLADELREAALDLGMLPLAAVSDGLPRAVRELCRSLGKDVELVVTGRETRLDKRVIEALGDMLVHLVSNSIAHGIEAPGQRAEQGKPPRGRLEISARSVGDRVVVVVEDDGRGLDAAAIKERAAQRRLATPDELARASRRELFELIFRPGFSTAARLSDIAGRGVGLDAVRRAAERLGGSVRVQSEAGAGTRFELDLPLTATMLRGLLVEAGGGMFALPVASVVEVMRCLPADLVETAGRPTLRRGEQLIPIERLDAVLDLPPAVAEPTALLIVEAGRRRVGLRVDRIFDEREILIRPLPQHLGKVAGIAGAAVIDDDRIVPILYAPDLVGGGAAAAPRRSAGRRVLVVDDSANTREIIRSVLEADGHRVDLAADGLEALERVGSTVYDLVVTDLDMPRLDGLGLIARLRGMQRYAATPIVIVSSQDSEAERRRGLDRGADAYIVKGAFEQDELVAAVDGLLS